MNEAEGKVATEKREFLSLDVAPSLVAAAHELKSPLVLLRQLTFQLEEENLLARSENNAEIARRMRLTTERALRLADNLTKAARLEDAMFSLEPIQLAGLCMTAVDEMKPLSQELGTKILFKPKRISRVAIGNRELLHALLVGLIDNALYYAGGKSVEVSAQISRNEAVLSVCDSGAKISLKDFRHLESSLGQTQMPLSARPLSSGLGLMIAQKFTTAMNGRLSVKRRATGGMIFSAHLPTSQQLSLLEL